MRKKTVLIIMFVGNAANFSESQPGATDEFNQPGENSKQKQMKFYEHAGPLHKAVISPRSCILKINERKNFRLQPRIEKLQ